MGYVNLYHWINILTFRVIFPRTTTAPLPKHIQNDIYVQVVSTFVRREYKLNLNLDSSVSKTGPIQPNSHNSCFPLSDWTKDARIYYYDSTTMEENLYRRIVTNKFSIYISQTVHQTKLSKTST